MGILVGVLVMLMNIVILIMIKGILMSVLPNVLEFRILIGVRRKLDMLGMLYIVLRRWKGVWVANL